MQGKMKECFTPHVLMHSLVGLGIGLVLADIWSGLAKAWIGVVLIVIGALLDFARKP